MAKKLIDGQVCQAQLGICNSALGEMAHALHPPIQFWQKPEFVVGGFVVTVSFTALIICASHAMGACK